MKIDYGTNPPEQIGTAADAPVLMHVAETPVPQRVLCTFGMCGHSDLDDCAPGTKAAQWAAAKTDALRVIADIIAEAQDDIFDPPPTNVDAALGWIKSRLALRGITPTDVPPGLTPALAAVYSRDVLGKDVTWPDPTARPSVINDRTPEIDWGALYEQAAGLVRQMVNEAASVSKANGSSPWKALPTPLEWHDWTLDVAEFLAGES